MRKKEKISLFFNHNVSIYVKIQCLKKVHPKTLEINDIAMFNNQNSTPQTNPYCRKHICRQLKTDPNQSMRCSMRFTTYTVFEVRDTFIYKEHVRNEIRNTKNPR